MKIFNFFTKVFNNTGLRFKLIFLVIAILFVSFLFVGLYVYQFQKKSLIADVDNSMYGNLHALERIVSTLSITGNSDNKYVLQGVKETLRDVEFKKNKTSINYTISQEQLFNDIEQKLNIIFNDIYNTERDNILSDIKYFNSGFPIIIHKTGKLIYHPSKTNSTVADKLFFTRIIASGQLKGKVEYLWPETSSGEEMLLYYQYNPDLESYIAATVFKKEVLSSLNTLGKQIFLLVLILLVVIPAIVYFIAGKFISKLDILVERIRQMALGENYKRLTYNNNDEIKQIINAIEDVSHGLEKTSHFARKIGKGELNAEFTPLSKNDVLGNILVEMQQSLKQNFDEEQKRKVEDERRSWSNQGLAKFNDIFRKQKNLKALGEDIVFNLADYLHIELCGLFLIEENKDGEEYLQLLASYAYDRKKHIEKSIDINDGLLGASIKEKKTIYLKKVPEEYVQITSGFGKATPREVIIIPLKDEDKIYGVIEIATLREIEQYEIEFIEAVAGIIASTISTTRITEQTNMLLNQSKIQSEELASREEELRQNMEEMSATQEESQRRENALIKQVEALERELNELKNKNK